MFPPPEAQSKWQVLSWERRVWLAKSLGSADPLRGLSGLVL
jgi:hypothetical protein